jgi:hypothetical protein
VRVRAQLDQPSRALWLIKWLLLIPHYIVLLGLWIAFIAMTLVAYVAVLFTGRYPRGIFNFNVGVLRWSWRVGYYGYQVLGTDRYPPFTLAEVADYPAGLSIEYPDRLPRYQPLIAWLLALPHAFLFAAIAGSSYTAQRDGHLVTQAGIGLVAVAVLIGAVGLLFSGTYPRGLFDLLTGIGRWGLRVCAYVALLTRRYPPFRLDQGGAEPVGPDGPDSAGAEPSVASSSVAPSVAGPPVAAATPRRTGGTAGRVVALVLGILLMLTGGAIGLGGGVLLAVNGARDDDGYATSRDLTLTSGTAAVVSSEVTVNGAGFRELRWGDFGAVRVTATGTNQSPVFIGVARSADVEQWLSGKAYDEVTRAWSRGDTPKYRRINDSAPVPIGAPADQTFWLSQASGSGTVQLDWDPLGKDGRFVLVLANADGSQAVAARTHVGIKVPGLVPLGSGLLIAAGVLLVLSVGLIYVGASGLGHRVGGHHAGRDATA